MKSIAIARMATVIDGGKGREDGVADDQQEGENRSEELSVSYPTVSSPTRSAEGNSSGTGTSASSSSSSSHRSENDSKIMNLDNHGKAEAIDHAADSRDRHGKKSGDNDDFDDDDDDDDRCGFDDCESYRGQ